MEVMSIWERFRNWLIGYNPPVYNVAVTVDGLTLKDLGDEFEHLAQSMVDDRDKWYNRYLTWRALAGKMRFQRNKARENTDAALKKLAALEADVAAWHHAYTHALIGLKSDLLKAEAELEDLKLQIADGPEYCGAV